MVERLGGVDISWIIGLIVPSILYYLFARRGPRPEADASDASARRPTQEPA
jgi:NCS1 family nucleobase:cation symporter-1